MKGVNLFTVIIFFMYSLKSNSQIESDLKNDNDKLASDGFAISTTVEVLDNKILAKIERGLDFKTIKSGVLSEDGNALYFEWDITGVNQIWKLNSPIGSVAQITSGRDFSKVFGITSHGKLLITRNTPENDSAGIYLASSENEELEEVFNKKKCYAKIIYLSIDGGFIFFSVIDQMTKAKNFYRYDLTTKKVVGFFNQKGNWIIKDVWQDEKKIIVAKILDDKTFSYYTYDLENEKLVPIDGIMGKEDYHIEFGSSSSDFIIQSELLSDFDNIYNLKNGKMIPLVPGLKYDVIDFHLDQKRQRLLYEVNVAGYTKVYGLSLPKYTPLQLPNFPIDSEHIYIEKTTRNSQYTFFNIGFHNKNLQGYVYDWNKKTLVQWTKNVIPEVNTEKLVKAKLEYLPARDGASIPYFVRIPIACENRSCPLIVNFHDGPEGQSLAGLSLQDEFFVREGFIVASPNIRGSDGYGKNWLDADNGKNRLRVITDIEDSGVYLKKKYNASKLGVMGTSFGGYLTLMGMSRFSGIFDAGVANGGIVKLDSFLKKSNPFESLSRINEYGNLETDLSTLIELSPYTYSDKLKSPLMVIHGENDFTIPFIDLLQFKKNADQKKIPFELVFFDNEEKKLTSLRAQSEIILKTINFFKKYLN
jgi:protease II